jgi:threonine dehydratase
MITKNEEVPKLAEAFEMKSLYFKREDLHPYGSHKGRSTPFMMNHYIKLGFKKFAISSSGNAALAAAHYVEHLNSIGVTGISLEILVGQHIKTKKLRKLEQFASDSIRITSHDRPLQTLFTITKDPEIKGLRQSNDDVSLIGYETLAAELAQIPNLKAVFMGTSSGTTAQALSQYFADNGLKIEFHIVQTSSCHELVNDFTNDPVIDEDSIADAIVDRTATRKNALLKLIKENGGNGWIASNEQILAAQEITKKNTSIDISTNSALSVAGLMQAVYTGNMWDGAVACIICGD